MKDGQTNQPNFLFFITDQHRADYLGCSGHPVLQTPNIDQLAANGTRFDRCYVANPVCMPNRAALLTGRLSSVNGVRQNGNNLPLHMTTFVQILKAAGYDTALLGKSHVQTMTSFPTPIGDNPAGHGPLSNAINIGDDALYQQEQDSEWQTHGREAVKLPFYGFDTAEIVSFHGDMTGSAHTRWLREQGIDPDTLRGPANQLAHDYTCPQAVRTAMPEELYSTSYIRNLAVNYLQEAKRKDKPFFAFVSFPDPHHPFTPPGKYWDMYKPEDMQVPENFDAHTNPPPHLQWVRKQPAPDPQTFKTDATSIGRRNLQESMALTCGMITMIDDAIGDVMQSLEDTELANNTIVIFTSDHGDYLGDHGLLFKGGLHFQSLIRVPFIWMDPRSQQPNNSQTLCSTIDFAPTILANANLSSYAGIQGINLTDIISSKNNKTDRDELLIEEQTYFDNVLGFDDQVRTRTLVTEQYRLSVYYGVSWGELYDLTNDPLETNNLWDNPNSQTLKQSLIMQLVQTMMGYADQSPWPTREA